MRFHRLFLVATVSIAAAICLIASACSGGEPEPRSVVILTEDGFRLSATEFGRGEKGVVIAHDAGGSKEDLAGFAAFLAKKGFHVVTVANRGYPGSDGAPDPSVMDRDLRGAARYLTSTGGAKSVAYLGAGAGGTLAIQAGAGDLPSASVVAISPLSEYETLNIDRSAEKLFQPKLVAFGAGDPVRAEQIEKLFQKMPPPKVFEPRPGQVNGTPLLLDDQELQSLIAVFLRENS